MTGSGCFDNYGGVSLVGEIEYGMEWWNKKIEWDGEYSYVILNGCESKNSLRA